MNYIKRPFHPTAVPGNVDESPLRVSATTTDNSNSSASVRFNESPSAPAKLNDREKYLTAKYPQEQMQLIRKRLKVEFWLDDQLRSLYNIEDDNSQDDHDHCPGDLIDSLLDIDTESERRTFLLEKLRNIKQARSIIMEFVDDLLYRVKML